MSTTNNSAKGQANASPSRVRVGGASGQAAVEVLAYASFFLLVFVMISSVFLSAQGQELSRAENAYAQEIAYGFSDSVRTSFIAGPGFAQVITIPPNLLGKPYLLRISSTSFGQGAQIKETGFAYIDWQGQANQQSFASPLVANSFDAVDTSDGFIKVDRGSPTQFITINASIGARLKLSNVLDSDGKGIILIEKG